MSTENVAANGNDIHEEPISSQERLNGAEGDDEIDVNEKIDWELRLGKRKDKGPRESPIVYRDIDPQAAFRVLESHTGKILTGEDVTAIQELKEFVTSDVGAWSLGAQHLTLIARILSDTTIELEARLSLLKILGAAALKDDVILLLHMDRKDHPLMNVVNKFEQLGKAEQEELAIFMCNLCLPRAASDWLLYISEWETEGATGLSSNSKVTTRVTVNSLLSEGAPSLQEKGVSLMFNLSLKEVFDDTATELASAILQYIQGNISEEHAFLLLTSLIRFMNVSYNDVPALVKMMDVNFAPLQSKSPRLEQLVEQINLKLNVILTE